MLFNDPFVRVVVSAAAVCAFTASVFAFPQGVTTKLSVGLGAAETDGNSDYPSITPDGRFVVYSSLATNLVVGDTNDTYDVFRLDRSTGAVIRASVSTSGVQDAQNSYQASISDDGDVIAFNSWSDFAPNDHPTGIDVFVRRVSTGETILVSQGMAGAAPNAPSSGSKVSGDGRFVMFDSSASNFVVGDTNGHSDVFVRDLLIGTTTLESRSSTGQLATSNCDAGAISRDGRYVVFATTAKLVSADTNTVQDTYVRDRTTGALTWVSRPASGVQPNNSSAGASISGDGRWIGFFSLASNMTPGDTNGFGDSFLFDRTTGHLERLLIGFGGAQAAGDVALTSISSDGRWLGLHTSAANVFAADLNGDYDAALVDRAIGAVMLLSRSTSGSPGDDTSVSVDVTDDGLTSVFWSRATNLVPGDLNGVMDVFLHQRPGASPVTFCTAKTNSLGCVPVIASSGVPSASSSAAFFVSASNVLSSELGLFFYGFVPAQTSFLGGTLCVQPPLVRTAAQFSGGNPTPGADCSGSYALEFNARIQSGLDARLVAGTQVNGQFWSRDALSPGAAGLTAAIAFTIAP